MTSVESVLRDTPAVVSDPDLAPIGCSLGVQSRRLCISGLRPSIRAHLGREFPSPLVQYLMLTQSSWRWYHTQIDLVDSSVRVVAHAPTNGISDRFWLNAGELLLVLVESSLIDNKGLGYGCFPF